MNARNRLAALAVLAVLLVCMLAVTDIGDVSAQAWVQRDGGFYLKISTSYLFTREEFNFAGDRQDIFADKFSRTDAWFRDVSVTTYFEYGVTDYMTLVTSIPFKILRSRETENAGPGFPLRRITRTNGGPGDVTLALRTPIMVQPFAVAVQYGGTVPLGYEQTPDNGGSPLGTGKLSGEVGIFVGRSLHPFPAYVSAGASYRRRQGGLHDEVLYNIEAGLTPGRFFFKVRFDGLQNVEEPPDLAIVANDAVVGDQDIFKLSGEADYRFAGPFALALEVFHTLGGKNTTTGTAYAAGLIVNH
jgi:hypothetical protein